VRMTFGPAVMSLLGERAWRLPRWLAWLPNADVEGLGLPEAGSEPAGAKSTRAKAPGEVLPETHEI